MADVVVPGMEVMVTDARGEQHHARAISAAEMGRDFPVVWVEFGDGAPLPWPADAVEVPRGTDA